jgi:peroxiredoxin
MAYGACDSADAKTAKRITYIIGPDGKVLKAYPKVSPAEHPGQILQEIATAA